MPSNKSFASKALAHSQLNKMHLRTKLKNICRNTKLPNIQQTKVTIPGIQTKNYQGCKEAGKHNP
jgi:hypothetical protein